MEVDERHGCTANTEHQDPKHRDLEPDMDAGGGRSYGEQRDHERHGDRVSDHLDGEGLGRHPGDGEVGDDHVRQPWNLGDVHLECPCGQPPCAARSLPKSVEGWVASYATQIVECSSQGEWGGEESSQHEDQPATDADAGQDDQDHDGCSGFTKSRGLGWGRDSRFMVPKPIANSPAITTRTIWPVVVENGVK